MKHTCHHPHCNQEIDPKFVSCRKEWFQLPLKIRNAIWFYYRKGQEIDKDPSPNYLLVLHAAMKWWHNNDIEHCNLKTCYVVRFLGAEG